MDKSSVSLGRMFGIEVFLHYSWFIVFALLAWSLSMSFFPQKYPGLKGAEYWVMGVASSFLLFCSVLLHEISHSLVAKYNKIKVDSITLFFFGGVAQINEKEFTPKKELQIAAAGPVFSFVFALLFFVLLKLSGSVFVTAISSYLLRLNLMLAFFNLVPGFPLDGGRILRAILWKKYNSIEKATYYAAEGGKIFAIFMIFFGISAMFFGGFGLWYILLGAFLYFIAKMSYKQTVIKSILEKVKVKEAMKKSFKCLDPDMPVEDFNFGYFVRYEQDIFPVTENKQFIGIVHQYHIEKAKQLKKGLFIGNITIPVWRIKTVSPNDNCFKAFELMIRQGIEMLPVVEDKKLVGILKGSTLVKLVDMRLGSVSQRNTQHK